jgi:hypothetical protein
MKKLATIISWVILALILLAVLFVQIDERCSGHADAWARHTTDMVSEKVSERD